MALLGSAKLRITNQYINSSDTRRDHVVIDNMGNIKNKKTQDNGLDTVREYAWRGFALVVARNVRHIRIDRFDQYWGSG